MQGPLNTVNTVVNTTSGVVCVKNDEASEVSNITGHETSEVSRRGLPHKE